jgi:hypothetical protein
MKALASRQRSCPISVCSFFCLRGALAQASDLVGDGNELLGQLFKAFVVGHQGLELRSLLSGNAFGELLTADIALEDIIRSLPGFGAGLSLLEELAAQGASAEAVDGLDLLEYLLPALFEL